MLNILFNPDEIIEIRCLHKDQTVKSGKTEPAPKIFHGVFERLQTRAFADSLRVLNHGGYNIYFGANPRHGTSKNEVTHCNTLFVDLDGAGHSISWEEAEEWRLAISNDWMLPRPTVSVSSGNGVHYYWRINRKMTTVEWHKAQKALIHTFNLSGKLADPSIHDAPRIMRLPGFTNHRGGAVAAIMEWDASRVYDYADFELCFDNIPVEPVYAIDPDYKGDNANALQRALSYFELREGMGEGGRNAEAFKIAAACLNDFGLSESDTFHVVQTWNGKNHPPLPESEIKTVIGKAHRHVGSATCSKDRPKPEKKKTAPPASKQPDGPPENWSGNQVRRNSSGLDLEIVRFMVENYVLVAGTTDVWDLQHGMMMPLAAMSALYSKEEMAAWKMDANRRIILSEDLVFSPSGDIKPHQINTFVGFQFEKDDRPMPLLTSHIEMLCDDDDKVIEWVMSWMAFQVQNPGQKLATSIIMHGKQGTGKSMLWECFGSIFRPYFGIIDQTVLESDFNSWASRKTFVLAEEVLANQSKSKLKNVIKQMVTGGKIQINQKFSRPWVEDCYMNMVFLSNNRMPMLLDDDDRRFMVIKCDNKQDEAYYMALAAEIKDNGPARLCSMLQKWNLCGFHAHTKPLNTLAKEDLITLTRDSAKQFMDEWLSDQIEGLPVYVCRKQDLYEAYATWCKLAGLRSSSKHHLYAVIDEDYQALSEIRDSNFRCYLPAGAEQTNFIQFEEALTKFIGRAQDRKL